MTLVFQDEGCNIIAVASGDAAIAELGRRQVDVVLAATKLPGRTGYEVSAWIKSRPESCAPRVILVKDVLEPLDISGEAGWDAVLDKPFAPQQLLTLVSSMAREGHSAGTEPSGSRSG